ncbi:MAG: nuclear transport factor 2 family protein [Desulfobacterales bacterium]|nr:nuclear transport factor 2 family protein [Desulfobacterales bacterium]
MKTSITILFAAASILFNGCDQPISEYSPAGPDEKEIISVLTRYQDAKNRHDLERVLSFLHDNGDYTFGCGIRVSKAELKSALPGFWAEMNSEKLAVVPLSHECLNGDYYRHGEFKNLELKVSKDTAKARVMFTQKFSSSLLLYFSLARENDQWLITRTEWGFS